MHGCRVLERAIWRTVRLRTLSTHAASPQEEAASTIQWVTSPQRVPQVPPPPPITHRVTFLCKSFPSLTVSTCSSSSAARSQDQSIHHHLSPEESVKVCAKLLSCNNRLSRSPRSLRPLSIEYSSPNIAKPLHMGHLRSTITGSYVRNIAAFAGHDCTSVCFLGDWGRGEYYIACVEILSSQFGVLHAGVLREMESQGSSDFNKFVGNLDLAQLLNIYVQATGTCEENKEFMATALNLSADLETRFGEDTQGNYLWSHTRAITVSHLKTCYSDLGVSFDAFEGESTYNRDSTHTSRALEMLDKLSLTLRHQDGSLRIRTGDVDSILLKRDNSSVYLLRDIACAVHRYETAPSRLFVYVVDIGQSSHFRNLFGILSTMGVSSKSGDFELPFSTTHTHVPFGRVSGMSTRSGNFVLLSDVLDQGTTLMHESRIKSKNARNTDDVDVSRRLAVSGLIVNALKMRRTKEYPFNWEDALRSNGNSGVALQYTVARLQSLITRAGTDSPVNVEANLSVLFEQRGKSGDVLAQLIVSLLNFEDTFWRSYTTLEPCVLVAYSFHLSDRISKALSTVNILNNEDKELANAALWLFSVSKMTLENCLSVLGVQPVGCF